MGTARHMPTTPQREPQSMRERRTTIGCRSIVSPNTRGSMKLPVIVCTTLLARERARTPAGVIRLAHYVALSGRQAIGLGSGLESKKIWTETE